MQLTINHNGQSLVGDAAYLLSQGVPQGTVRAAAEAYMYKQFAVDFEAECSVILGRYSRLEINSFAFLLPEAKQFTSGIDETPLIDRILAITGDDKATYVQSILDNANAYFDVVGAAIAKRRMAQKQLDAAADIEALQDVKFGDNQ